MKIAILDTGYSAEHPSVWGRVNAYMTFAGDSIVDTDGHGTACAGIVASTSPLAELLIGKVISDDSDMGALTQGIYWACENNADVISISLGSWIGDDALEAACKHAVEGHHWVVAAAGNSGPMPGSVQYPAAYDCVIAVGAIEHFLWWDTVAEYSSRGTQLDVVAPGSDIRCAWPPAGYKDLSGTSMACPYVAATLGNVIEKHRREPGDTPCDTYDQVCEHLLRRATDRGKKGHDSKWGWGIVNPVASLAMINTGGNNELV